LLFSHSILRAHFLPNGNHDPGELIRRQLAFLPTRWDMPCRINLSRILSRRSLIRRIAWPDNHE
ncbi:MAG: hypothetical protein ACKOAH_11315, partial [Pirellula sp.]